MSESWSSPSKKLLLCLHPANKKQTNNHTVQHHEKIKHPPLALWEQIYRRQSSEKKNKNSTDTQKVNVVYDATEDRCRLCIFLFQFHGVFLLCNRFFNLQTLYIYMNDKN